MTATATSPALLSPSGGRPRNDLMQLIATANRGDLSRVPGQFWPDITINGQVRPEARSLVGQLIRDGLLYEVTPGADTTAIEPTPAGLSKIGVTR